MRTQTRICLQNYAYVMLYVVKFLSIWLCFMAMYQHKQGIQWKSQSFIVIYAGLYLYFLWFICSKYKYVQTVFTFRKHSRKEAFTSMRRSSMHTSMMRRRSTLCSSNANSPLVGSSRHATTEFSCNTDCSSLSVPPEMKRLWLFKKVWIHLWWWNLVANYQ